MSTEVDKNPVPKASSADDFRKKREERSNPQELELPSGLKVLYRRPALKKLIKQGLIPDSLASKVVNQSSGQSKLSGKDLEDYFSLQEIIVKHSLVDPEIVDDPDPKKNQIVIGDLDDLDQAAIFEATMGPGARPPQVESFRGD